MSIKQLASALGLSTSTVSRALNGYTDVNEQTRLRVQEMPGVDHTCSGQAARKLAEQHTLEWLKSNFETPAKADLAGAARGPQSSRPS